MALLSTPEVEIGKSAPQFELKAIDNKIYKNSDFFIGKPVVIMFICNHCPYVKAIEDRLIQLGKDLKNINIPLVAIGSNDADAYPEDSFENMQLRAREKNYSFLYLHDPTQQAAKDFGAVCTPDFFVYDNKGLLAYRGRLDDNWKNADQVTKRELFDAVKLLDQNKNLDSIQQNPSMGCSMKWKS